MNYNWNWGILATDPYTGWILSGLTWTILVALAAWVIAFSLGSVIGILRTLDVGWARGFAVGYVAIFRNIPLLVQMFLWYFVVPEVLPEAAGQWVKARYPQSGILDRRRLSGNLYRGPGQRTGALGH